MRWILRLLIFFLSAWGWGLEGQTPRRTLCVMEYNVENLFDTEMILTMPMKTSYLTGATIGHLLAIA